MTADTRRANLRTLLEERFAGKIAAMARAIQRDDAYLWQLLNPSKNGRQVGERTARHIEKKLSLASGALDIPGMATVDPPKPDEMELIRLYRRASPSWQIALRYLAALRGDVQDEISQSVNVLLSKVSAEHVDDRRVAAAYGHPPGLVHEPGPPGYRKKS